MIDYQKIGFCSLLLILAIGLSSCTQVKPPPAPNFEGYSDEPEFTTAPGEEKTITFRWSAPTGSDITNRKRARITPRYSVCITSGLGGRPGGADQCYDLVNVSCAVRAANTALESRDCTGELLLPSELHGVQTDWYIRATDSEEEKVYSNSNTRSFAWNIALPNLRITDDSPPTIVGQRLSYRVEITNSGAAPAANVLVRFNVELNAGGLAQPSQIFDVVSQRTLKGTNQNQGEDTDFVSAEVDIGGMARPIDYLFTATVDPDNSIAESNENDNERQPRGGTVF